MDQETIADIGLTFSQAAERLREYGEGNNALRDSLKSTPNSAHFYQNLDGFLASTEALHRSLSQSNVDEALKTGNKFLEVMGSFKEGHAFRRRRALSPTARDLDSHEARGVQKKYESWIVVLTVAIRRARALMEGRDPARHLLSAAGSMTEARADIKAAKEFFDVLEKYESSDRLKTIRSSTSRPRI